MAPSERDSGRNRHHSQSPRPRGNSRERRSENGRRRKYSVSPEGDRRRSTRDDRERRRSPERSPRSRRDLSKDRSRQRDSERRSSRDPDRPRRRRRSPSFEDSATGRREIESTRPRDDADRQLSRRHERSRSRDRRRRRSRDRSPDHHRRRRRDDSPPPKRRRRSQSRSKSPAAPRDRAALPSQQSQFQQEVDPTAEVPIEKQMPNFNASGLLAKEANTIAGTNTVLKYHEPAEARKPSTKEQWRIYIFKQKDMLDTIHLYSRSCWLFGRDQAVADFALEHPSVSKQHAVVQFRYIAKTNEFGDRIGKVKPYLIDLESANGTKLNGKRIEASRYVELRDGDVVGFGESEGEYVVMLPPA